MTTEPTAEGARIWGGTTLDERRAARRRQLVETGLDLLGGEATGAVSVRAACRGAQLTERYFYESFEDRDALVLAVYEEVADEARSALEERDPAPRRTRRRRPPLRRGDGRAHGRRPPQGPGAARRADHRAVPGQPHHGARAGRSPAMIRCQLPPGTSERTRALIATGLLGALMSLFHAYLQGTLQVSREAFVEHCVRLLLNVDKLR